MIQILMKVIKTSMNQHDETVRINHSTNLVAYIWKAFKIEAEGNY